MAVSQSHANNAIPGMTSRKWWVLVSVVFGIFMVILDTTVVNVAFQALRAEFGANLSDSQWIISVYVLALGVSTPLSGFLADRFGSKKVYIFGLMIFIIGSFLSGISPNLPFLVVARAIQGIGGGIAVPLGSAILLRTFPASEQGQALGIFGIALLVAPALGPILGGFLVDHNLWRFIFFINPPIGVLGIILGSYFLPDFKGERKPSLDILGLITECIGFGAILYAASIAANQGWSAPGVLTSLIIGIVGLALFAIIELFVAKDPLLDLRLYTKRTFLNANLLGYVAVIALFGAEFMMPLYLQFLRGMTAFQTGLILLPMAISGGITTIIAGRLYDKLGPRPLVVFGYSILIINTWQLSQIKANTPVSFIMLLLALRGLAVGATVQTTFITALSVVPLKRVARGSSLTNATRNVIQAIGIAILAAVLAGALSPQISALQQQFLDQPPKPGVAPVAVCLTTPLPALASTNLNASAGDPPAQSGVTLPSNATKLLAQACQENVKGFESAYKITFYAAFLALALGLMLPGWPLKFAGRRAADSPTAMGH